MSYNLMAEGHLDLFELSGLVGQFEPLELFPIPADADASGPPNARQFEPDALGIAVPSSRSGDGAVAALRGLVRLLWAKEARVFDLYAGAAIETDDELEEVLRRIGPPR